ncbi:MAG: M64 family metallopeptidase [Bacteroidota bacterium]
MSRILVLTFCAITIWGHSQDTFSKYFEEGSMRVDFMLAGNNTSEQVFMDQVKKEPYWGGSKVNLVDTLNLGNFRYMVYDSLSGNLLYSRGFCSLFQEWQATPEALKINRSFYETVVFPFPLNTIKLELYKRNRDNSMTLLLEHYICPRNYFIKEDILKFPVEQIKHSGEPAKSLDIVFLPDGYTKDEMGKFREDVNRFAGYLLKAKPFNGFTDMINIWCVLAPSQDSGTDIPGEGVWKTTILNSSFYTFDTDRYLTTFDIKSVRDMAANAPYDQIYILVNTDIYGGGGVYNYYSLCSSDNFMSEQVFLHEFGHGFAGLADEYYTSDVAVEEYYDLKVEPWEPNITTMADFGKKWKNMIAKGTPIPTPYDRRYFGKVGLFEGAGYSARNIYRPYYECTMKTLDAPDGFCPVCSKAIYDMLMFYVK